MNGSIANTVSTLALAAGILGYVYLKYRGRPRCIEIIHQERMAAIEKGTALPEFPSDPVGQPDQRVFPILGTAFVSLSTGAMLLLLLCLPHQPTASRSPLCRRSSSTSTFRQSRTPPGWCRFR